MSASTGLTGIWAPRAGWFGVNLVNTAVVVGTGGTSIADSVTTSVLSEVPGSITSFSRSEAKLVAANVTVLVAAASAGTVTARIFKRNNQPAVPADVAMTATLSLKTDIVTTLDWTYAFALTATDAQALFSTTDACRIDLVASGAVTTQPTATISLLWAVRRIA